MKAKVLIIENDCHKSFAIKQVLEIQLHVKVSVLHISSTRELAARAQILNPDLIIFRPSGGSAGLLNKMKKRRTNRRNTEVVIALAPDLEESVLRRLHEVVGSDSKRVAHAA